MYTQGVLYVLTTIVQYGTTYKKFLGQVRPNAPPLWNETNDSQLFTCQYANAVPMRGQRKTKRMYIQWITIQLDNFLDLRLR